MRKRAFYLDVGREEICDLPVSCALLKHRQGNALFDTGCSPRGATDFDSYWGHLAKVMTAIYEPQDTVVAQLPKVGLRPEDIDLVVCSHLHTDHCGCNIFFPRATVICTRAELEAAKGGGGAYVASDWDLPQTFMTFDGAHDVFGDGRFTLIEAPGHSAGMAIGHIVLDNHAFVLASDAIPVGPVLERRYAPKGSWDDEKMLASIDEIARLQANGATVLFGHDEDQWQTLRHSEAYYE